MERGRTELADELQDLAGVAYGVHVRGKLPADFRPYLLPVAGRGAGTADSLQVTYRRIGRVPAVEEVWASDDEEPRVARFALFREPEGFGLVVSGEARGLFRCGSRRIGVEWAGAAHEAPHYFFSYALPLWLETRGAPVLHASVVAMTGGAVAFLAPTGTGKSVLCAELLRLGCRFVADDGLVPRRGAAGGWLCFPGPPLLRLWPSGLVGRLEIEPGTLPKVRESLEKRRLPVGRGLGGGRALPAGEGLPLAALYVLERQPEPGGGVTISELTPRAALVHLLEHGVAAGPAAVLGLSGQRLEILADLAEAVPARVLRYPSGADSAATVLKAIQEDLVPRGV